MLVYNYTTEDGELYHSGIEGDELYHYGVVGMKWGMRRARNKGTTYTYRSHSTKKWEKRANRAMKKNPTSNKAKIYSAKAKASSSHDAQMQSFAKRRTKGEAVVVALLGGSSLMKGYASRKASGMSSGRAAAGTLLTGTVGSAMAKHKIIKNAGEKAVNKNASDVKFVGNNPGQKAKEIGTRAGDAAIRTAKNTSNAASSAKKKIKNRYNSL